jgi:hypothetical protein
MPDEVIADPTPYGGGARALPLLMHYELD